MRKVKFSVSTGFVGSKREKTFNLEDLGINLEDYKTELELENAIDESFQEWVLDNIDSSWDFEEE